MKRTLSRTFGVISAITGRELFSLAVSPATWFIVGLFVLICSFVLYLAPLQYGSASFAPIADLVKFLGVFFAPLITMRLFAEERRAGTIETLMTAPVRPAEAVVAKALSGVVFYSLMLAPCAAYALILSRVGNVDGGTVAANLAGLAFLGAVYVCVGVFVSAVATSQIAAAAGGIVILLSLWLAHELGGDSSTIGVFFRALSFKRHYDGSFGKGVFDSADALYFLSMAGFFLTLAWAVVGTGAAGVRARPEAAGLRGVAVLGAVAFEAALVGVALADCLAGLEYGFFGWMGVSISFVLAVGCATAACVRLWRAGVFARGGDGPRGATLAGLAALAVILVNVNIMASRPAVHVRLDWSEAGVNSLDPRTTETLRLLESECLVTVFFTAADKYEGFNLLAETRALLTEYMAASPRVRVIYVDPAQTPRQAMEMAQALRLDPNRLDRTALVQYAGRKAVVPMELVLQKQMSMAGGGPQLAFMGEQAFTSGIRRVLDPRIPHIYVTQGHGEFQPFDQQGGARSAGQFVQALRMDGMRVDRVDLDAVGAAPADCDALVIPGPFSPFTAVELSAIEAYVTRGGRVLILMDPPVAGDEATGLEPLVRTWGIDPGADTALDAREAIAGDAATISALGSDKHPITAGRTVVCYLTQARSIGIAASAREGWTARAVLMSTKSAESHRRVGKELLPGRKGPFPLAVSAEHTGGGRVLMVGDADCAGPLCFGIGHNRAFLMSSMQWLLGRNAMIEIPERADLDRSLRVTAADRKFIWWTALIGLPQVWAIMGALVWWLRRQ